MAAAFMAEMIRKIAEGKYTPDELSAFLVELDELDEASYIQVFNELYTHTASQVSGTIDPRFKTTLEGKLDGMPIKIDADERGDSPVVKMRPGRSWIRWTTAAAVILCLCGGAYLVSTWTKEKSTIAAIPKTDIPPPSIVRAIITLGNGRQVYLDSASNGTLARQGNAQVVKLANGQVAYKVESSANREMLYNTLANPRGSQVVTITLSDGTRVWLNAESSIRYPVIFTGQDRTVEISGEAYFEVSKKPDQPFIVDIKNGAKIEVLGTDFNVSAYPDENNIKTTLLDGSVRVGSLVGVNTNKDKLSVVLKPGQQAQVVGFKANNGIGNTNSGAGNTNNGSSITKNGMGQINVVNKVDTAAIMAWKNGQFAFVDADLSTVMRQLARWYDVTVLYKGNLAHRQFDGEIYKDLSLDQVLHILTNHKVHYTIQPNRILIIRP